MPAAGPDLHKIIAQLAAHYGNPKPPITTDPFELILLENVAYLVSDERREEAFKMLRQHGKELCKTNAPLCEKCPVRKSCAYFKSVF
jgi:adenine-specific DNA glycosylase